MSGPIITACARTARKRTIGALAFLRLSENLEENLDNKLLWATLPHETTESVSTNGSNRPNSQTWHRLAVWTVGALVAGIRSKTRV